MKEREFTTDSVYDLETFQDLQNHCRPLPVRLLLRLSLPVLFAAIIYLAVRSPEFLKVPTGICLVLLGLAWVRNRDGGAGYRKFQETYNGVVPRNIVTIHDGGFHCWNPETGNKKDIPFSAVTAIDRGKNAWFLTVEERHFPLNIPRLTGGTPAELEAFLLERCPPKKIRKSVSDRVYQQTVACICAAAFLWSFLGIYTAFEPKPVAMSAYDAAAALEELGITPPEEETLRELQAYGASEYMIADVLYSAGCGEYDLDTWLWTPPDSGVYAFDLEVFELSRMYTNFLAGVEAASRGELDFTNITECDDHVDFESGTGYKTVTFTLDGKEYTLKPTMMSDWFDVTFAEEVARIVGTRENGKQLRFWYDGYQMAYVFYADDGWAESFADATGYTLSTSFGY